MKRKIYLEGELGQLFTPELEADVRNVSDAIKLLDANFDGAFRKYLAESDSKGLDFVVEIDKKESSVGAFLFIRVHRTVKSFTSESLII